ncbi:MAG: aldo/keto reductase [Bryobacterales bacterium]|nr:aldo/keto reductase [Bryobacterales bacterium]
MPESRRDFVKATAGLGLAASAAAAEPVPRRKFGNTGLEVSIVGLGGGRVGTHRDEAEALRTIRHCYDSGINYFDTAAAGAYGLSQRRYGIALGGVPRDQLIYGTKTRHRTYSHSELDLNQSLAGLKTDYIDLYQVHNVMHMHDIDFVFGPRGVMEMIEKARRDGKVRYVGFTGHMDPRILLKMLNAYDWDTVLMPLSVTDGANQDLSFERTTLPPAVEKGLGIMAMKTTGVGVLHEQGISSLEENLDYVWSLPISTAILGCTSPEQVDRDIRAARAHTKLSEPQMSALRARWAKSDFAQLESWKVDQSATMASSGRRYVGD